MMGQDTHEVERKVVAILRVLSDSPQPLGGRLIARRLNNLGIDLGERAVRYHLKLMDERGFTRLAGRRDGRLITPSGLEELKSALITDRVGLVIDKIELLAYQTSFCPEDLGGQLPVNLSLFRKEEFGQAVEAMKEVFRAGLCVSDLVAVAVAGQRLGETTVPEGDIGLVTVSSIAVSALLLKAGVPLDPRFGGILQIRNHKPLRFTELIEYSGCSLDPAEVFIAGKMTSVSEVAARGEGKIVANFYEFPTPCRPTAETVIGKLVKTGLGGLVMIGETSEPLCEIPVRSSKVGMILQSGLNPIAAATEAGIQVTNHAMSGVIDFRKLKPFWNIQVAEGR